MRQSWEEHEANHDAFLAYLDRAGRGEVSPYRSAARWRLRFFISLLINVGLVGVLFFRFRGE